MYYDTGHCLSMWDVCRLYTHVGDLRLAIMAIVSSSTHRESLLQATQC